MTLTVPELATHDPTVASPASPPIPEDAPTVAMDIRLGEHYDYVDFDYDAFKAEADRQGMSAARQSELQINALPPAMYGRKTGHYRPSTKTMGVNVGDKVNSQLVHELRHATDHEEGRIGELDARNIVGRLGLLATKAVVIPAHAGVLVGIAAGSETAQHISLGPIQAVSAAVVAATAWGYGRHPAERRAVQEAKLSNPSIITTIPRQK